MGAAVLAQSAHSQSSDPADFSIYLATQTHGLPIWDAMDLKQLITIDNDILGGQTVFQGMRVPVESLFDHLEAGISLDGFLEEFPTVSKEQAVGLLEWANKLLNTKNPDRLYAAVT